MYLDFDLFSPNLKKTQAVCLAVLIFTMLCGQALAQSADTSIRMEGAQISLLTAPTMAGALLGNALTLEQDERLAFVSIELDTGWKTYWRLPGRFGFAPVLDWSQSENVASVAALFPLPSLFDEGDGTSIGYSDDVLWPVRVQPIDPKEPIVVSLTIELGLCEELCFPVSADLSARLSSSSGEVASMAAVSALAGSLPGEETAMPAGAFEQSDAGLTLTLAQTASPASFAVAENDEGKHSLLHRDASGVLRGPWRHEAAPNRVTVISPDVGMQIFLLGT